MGKLPSGMREFDDYDAARENIHGGVLEALKGRFPVEDATHSLQLADVRLDGPSSYTLKQQKDALLRDRNLHTPVKGTWKLVDKASGKVLDQREDTVMHIPYMTQRGTFIDNGSEYTLVSQARLKPGVYTRKQLSGNYEAHVNVKPGTGQGFRIWMEPETGLFRAKVGQANIPLYPLLNMMGVPDTDMEKSWGADMLALNRAKVDRLAQQKLCARFLPEGATYASDAERSAALKDVLGKSQLDPWVVGQTMGLPDTSSITPKLLVRTAQKLLHIHRGEEKVDDRDALHYTTVMAPEDLFRERVEKDAGQTARTLLWKVKRDKTLKRVGRLALNPYMDSLIHSSGLASPLEETNPVQLLEQANRLTRFGVGGIGDPEAVLSGARDVNGSQLGFVDPVAGPESSRAGVDVRMAYRTFKGPNQRIYAEFRNNRTGKMEYLSPEEVVDKSVAFPGEPDSDHMLVARVGDSIQRMPAKDVDYQVPSPAHMFNYNLNLVNMREGMQPARGFYANKYHTQFISMPKGEPPLVQTLSPDGKTTFHELVGRKVGCVVAEDPGTVTRVSGDAIHVKEDDGRSRSYDIVKDFPFNRMSVFTNTPLVKAGDRVKAGALLAHSNFTDAETGSLNMGRNLKTAVMALRGTNNNDAYCISESAAKKMTTERMFESSQSTQNNTALGRDRFMSLFPKVYSAKQLESIGDEGIVKPGTVVQKGDPLILAVRPRTLSTKDAMLGNLHKVLGQNAHVDSSVSWDHAEPGIVIDAVGSSRGAKVNVKSVSPAKEGDKLCLTSDHDMLLSTGWTPIRNVKPGDLALSLDKAGVIEFVPVVSNHVSYVSEHLTRVENGDVSLMGTMNHKMYAANPSRLVRRKGEDRSTLQFELDAVSSLMNKDMLYCRAGRNLNADSGEYGDSELKVLGALMLDVSGHACSNNLAPLAFGLSQRQAAVVLDSAFEGAPDGVVVSTRLQADNLSCFAVAAGVAVRCSPTGARRRVCRVDDPHPKVAKADYSQERFRGPVYGPELRRNHIVYVRRDGKCCFTGNSNQSASKGVVGSVLSDEQMPRDPVTGEAYDIVLNPMTVQSRVAPNQIVELQLAKVAHATGKPYRLPAEPPPEGWSQFSKDELTKAGLPESEDIFDPSTGRTIKGVSTGHMYFSAFHHLAEKKLTGRSVGSYDSGEQPSRGGDDYAQAQRFGNLDLAAVLSHNAPSVIKDAMLIRGAKNEEYWKALKYGRPIPEPGRPFMYDKFFNLLKAGGINTTQKGDTISLLPMTDTAISNLAGGRQVRTGEQITNKMAPIEGGLFDIGQTGGLSGNKWSAIHLPEPVPNPVMQEPIIKVLGLTERRMLDIVAGREQLNGKTGGAAIRDALGALDVDKELKRLRDRALKSRGAVRDNAIKAIGYLDATKKAGAGPAEWMISKVPVIPPMFRPISRMGDVKLVSDLNELYADVAETASNLRGLVGQVGAPALYDEREKMYHAVAAAFGLGESINPEGRAKKLQGAIRIITGEHAKGGMFQGKLLAKPQDMVGRAVVTPDPSLGMDEVAVPEEKAWHLYKPFVTRRLVRRGYTAERALKAIEDKEPVASDMLQQEMAERPMLIDRAPAWHKFNIMAVHGKPIKSDTMRVCPLIAAAFNLDHDGDTMSFHVPVADKAVSQAKEKMYPSRNLFKTSTLRDVMHRPIHEMSMGLHTASTFPSSGARPRKFPTVEAALGAYRRGELGLGDPVEIA